MKCRCIIDNNTSTLPFTKTNIPCQTKKEAGKIERSGYSFYNFYRCDWYINLLWFKPFNNSHFYDWTFIEPALNSNEITIPLGIPVLYDWSKDELDDMSNDNIGKISIDKGILKP